MVQALVNWDPVDKTVLADEQVDENGNSWRSGAKVQKKLLNQWFIRTTQFAKDLLNGLNDEILYDWRDIVKLQKHWIGKCNGVNFYFPIVGVKNKTVTLWTPNPEYLDQVKFVAVTENHVLARKENVKLINELHQLKIMLINPMTRENIPVFVTNEIEFLPQTDSYLGIPCLRENDALFANKYNIQFTSIDEELEEEVLDEKREHVCKIAKLNGYGGYWSSAKLKDWLISRQRYWGTPIPIIHCKKCGPQPVPRDQLPVKLPKLDKLSEKGSSQLAELDDWIQTTCPQCGALSKRETDTMDTFVDSSWYYLRYLDPNYKENMFKVKLAKRLTPVDLYIGGKEHGKNTRTDYKFISIIILVLY